MKKIPLSFYVLLIFLTLVLLSCEELARQEQKETKEKNEKIFRLEGEHDLVVKDSSLVYKRTDQEDRYISKKICFSWKKDSLTTYSAYFETANYYWNCPNCCKVIIDSSESYTKPTVKFVVRDHASLPRSIIFTGDGELQDYITNFVDHIIIKCHKKDTGLLKLN